MGSLIHSNRRLEEKIGGRIEFGINTGVNALSVEPMTKLRVIFN